MTPKIRPMTSSADVSTVRTILVVDVVPVTNGIFVIADRVVDWVLVANVAVVEVDEVVVVLVLEIVFVVVTAILFIFATSLPANRAKPVPYVKLSSAVEGPG
jgi:hypothetical protein